MLRINKWQFNVTSDGESEIKICSFSFKFCRSLNNFFESFFCPFLLSLSHSAILEIKITDFQETKLKGQIISMRVNKTKMSKTSFNFRNNKVPVYNYIVN